MTKSKYEQTKDAALVALKGSNSLAEAAEKAGLSEQAMYGFLHNDNDFARAYEEARTLQAISYAETLTARRNHALDVIAALMDDEEQPGAVRLKAAQAILAATAEQTPVVEKIVSHEVFRTERRRGF